MRNLFMLFIVIIISITTSAQDTKRKITLEDLYVQDTFASKTVRGINSMNDGEHYTTLDHEGKILKYNFSKGDLVGVLFDPSDFQDQVVLPIYSYELSDDESKILITTQVSPIYRHSFTANYFIYDIVNKSLNSLSEYGPQMNAAFSPNGFNVAFVRDNNIFIKNLEKGIEKQITFDGEFNKIINGGVDWVYEEEFRLITGLQWSPDSRRIAFYRFDESHVKLFHMPMYMNQLYPPNYSFKYPKAGEENSVVEIHVYDLAEDKMVKMDIGPETDQYIARVKWTKDPEQVSLVRLNRLQNKVDILICKASTGDSKTIYSEENRYYIEEPTDEYPTYTNDGKHFIIQSERDGFNHIYLYSMDGTFIRQLTNGENEVISVYGYDDKSERVFYNAYDGSPLQTSVYYASVDGKKQVKLSKLEGTNSAMFSEGFKYYIQFHSAVSTPNVVTLHRANGKQIRVLEDNAHLKDVVSSFEIPSKEFFSFTTSEGVVLNGYMVKPLGFEESNEYPVLMYQYSGPGSIAVADRFRIGWDEYLATEGYVVVCVDGRGTGGRGEEFKKMTYGQLGYYESIDQIEAAKYLQTLPYIDGDRIGIWGWSYGGYMSSLCLFKAPDLFKMAIAVAPVTNWRYYDTVYTERFMGLPQDNASGYDDNSPINHVGGLQGKLLLVHGTGDDNVHVQNTIELAERLIQANKQFDMMLYPDKNHGIYGGNTTYHLYNLLSNYVKKNL